MIAMAIASMTMADRKGAQFDSSIMDFMAIPDSGSEHRCSTRGKLERGEPKNIDPAQKRSDQRLTFRRKCRNSLAMIKDRAQ